MLWLLLGVGIFVGMHRPKSLCETFDLSSLKLSPKEIRPHWIALGIVLAALMHIIPHTWGNRIVGEMIRRSGSEGGFIYVVTAMLLGSILDEAIMRGYLYQGFRNIHGRLTGIIIISILSILLHPDLYHGPIYAVCFYAGFGALLCCIFESNNNLMDCMVFHIGYTGTLLVVSKLIVSAN